MNCSKTPKCKPKQEYERKVKICPRKKESLSTKESLNAQNEHQVEKGSKSSKNWAEGPKGSLIPKMRHTRKVSL